MNEQTAFSRMLQDIVELSLIVLQPEPLNAEIRRQERGKKFRVQTARKQLSRPETTVLGSVFGLLICVHAHAKYTFAGRALTPGEILITFVLYADTLLSINQIAHLFDSIYDTIYTTIREVGVAFERGFHLVWTDLQEDVGSPTQIDETGQKCSGYKRQTPPRDGLSRGGSGEPGRLRWEGALGDTMTLVGACRDTLHVLRAEHGAAPQTDA